MVFVMALMVAGDKVIHAERYALIEVVLVSQFHKVVNVRSTGNQLATKIADALVTEYDRFTNLLPSFGFVDFLVLLR